MKMAFRSSTQTFVPLLDLTATRSKGPHVAAAFSNTWLELMSETRLAPKNVLGALRFSQKQSFSTFSQAQKWHGDMVAGCIGKMSKIPQTFSAQSRAALRGDSIASRQRTHCENANVNAY
jgi:AMMECR1 domain-containing protein